MAGECLFVVERVEVREVKLEERIYLRNHSLTAEEEKICEYGTCQTRPRTDDELPSVSFGGRGHVIRKGCWPFSKYLNLLLPSYTRVRER